ncbi:hypothetical protein [Mycolicibacterium septicum]|uniref:hypothetical protein n=1 Tax=Mycolicibacterium septicum TaxID=98668 RepID=UPI001AF61983|nr:hypothetical protein [Mycolicibacterium septicum]QRY51710.1 hypothetical protein JVX95_30765 [Mycolicibacterium septicum]
MTSEVIALIERARGEGWDVEYSGTVLVIDNGDRLTVYRNDDDELVMFGSVAYGDDPLYLSDDYPFDLDKAVRFLSGERWEL